MRAQSLPAFVLVAAAFGAFLAAARADEPPTVASIRAKIAALDVAGARADLVDLTSRTKALKDQVELKELNRQITVAITLQRVHGRLSMLLDGGKAREAYYEGMQAVDQNKDAIGLAALRTQIHDAREGFALVADDFDKTLVPESPTDGGAGGKTSAVGEAVVGNSKVQSVPDPLGGRALRWAYDSMPPRQSAELVLAFPREAALAEFAYLSFRLKIGKGSFTRVTKFVKQKSITVGLESGKGGPGEWATFDVDLGPSPLQPGAPSPVVGPDVRVPLEKLARGPKFDPGKVSGVGFWCSADGPIELVIDDVMLARVEK